MSGAAAADPAPGARSGAWRTAELLCALSFGSGLAAAERMEHGTNTAFVGTQLGRALGLGADGLEAVFYGALLKDVGCGACGAVLAPFFADDARDKDLSFQQQTTDEHFVEESRNALTSGSFMLF